MRKGRKSLIVLVWSVFLFFLGVYMSEYISHFLEKVLFVMGAVPWWYWFASAIVFTLLLLWLNDYFVNNVYLRSAKMKRIMQFTAGFGFWSSTSWVFDNIMYPGVIAWRGLLEGGIIMSVLAILITAIFLVVYEYKKVDWMGMDALHSIRDNGEGWIRKWSGKRHSNILVRFCMRALMFFPVLFLRTALWMLNKGDAFAFVGLSLLSDPFVTTIYLRHGKFDGLKKKDWWIFISSGILANFYWTLRSYGVVVIIRYIVNAIV